jgi:RNA polymerase sigma-70 factor (ECF subfamily)
LTEEIARAFLVSPSTLAQRIVRAKKRIQEERIPYQVPARAELSARLDGVLRVVYLVFNEGYSPSSGAEATRHDLAAGRSASDDSAGARAPRGRGCSR